MEEYLKKIVESLAISGFRNAKSNTWESAMLLMEELIKETGFIPEVFEWSDEKGIKYRNFSIFLNGKSEKRIVLGAHYDSYDITPGADDNASAVAVSLALLKELKSCEVLNQSLEFVFYACEEPPFFGTEGMGSFIHAKSVNKKDINFMICLEMVGYFSDEKNSQDFPFRFFNYIYGNKGNFLLFVSNIKSRRKAIKMVNFFKGSRSNFYKKLIFPARFFGLDWSDHRSYWDLGIPAVMITNTAGFRNKKYHTLEDTADRLDFLRMSYLVKDLKKYVLLENGTGLRMSELKNLEK